MGSINAMNRCQWLKTVAFVIACVIGALAALMHRNAVAGEPVVEDEFPTDAKSVLREKPAVRREKPVATKQIAILASLHSVVWIPDMQPATRNYRISVGQKLAFKSGLAEILYATGTKIVIEGPAEYTVGNLEDVEKKQEENHHSGGLQLGKLVAQAKTQKANEFVVDISNAKVMVVASEIGAAEFGVEVKSSGAAEVVVFAGAVEIVREASEERPEQRVRLSAGQATVVAEKTGEISEPKDADPRVEVKAQESYKEQD